MEKHQVIMFFDFIMKVKYAVACKATKDSVWLCMFQMDLEVVPSAKNPMTLYYDNSSVLANSKEPQSYKRGKHIESKYHLLREETYL